MNYHLKRTGQAVFTAYVVVTFTFVMIRLMPGGPAQFLKARLERVAGVNLNPETLNQMVSQYMTVDLSQPVWQQYLEYMGNVLQGDLGTSFYYNEATWQILARALPWTAFVMSISIFLLFFLGILLGAAMAYKEGSRFDSSLTGLSTLLNSVPYFLAAVFFVYLFGYVLGWFPTRGVAGAGVEPGFTIPYVTSMLHHAALPIFSVVITGFGFEALAMRGNSISVLGEDYLRVAHLRGLSSERIITRYVTRNAILPMYTRIMISVGFVFGGSVILERIFVYRGVGFYIYRAIRARDYPLMMGGFIFISFAVIFGVLIADLTYGYLDPRATAGGQNE